MKIRKSIKYREYEDCFGGYEDYDATRGESARAATDANVVLLHGVARSASVKLFDVLSDHDFSHQMILLDKIETLFVRVRLHHFANVQNAKFRQECCRKSNKKWQKLGVQLPGLLK